MPPVCYFCRRPTPTSIYTLSLHDALPIYSPPRPLLLSRVSGSSAPSRAVWARATSSSSGSGPDGPAGRSEEHTSELQSHVNLVCRLVLEKKKRLSFDLVFGPLSSSRTCRH